MFPSQLTNIDWKLGKKKSDIFNDKKEVKLGELYSITVHALKLVDVQTSHVERMH